MMHTITLRFLNKELEVKYEEFYNEEQIQTIREYLKQYILLCLICMIAFYVEGLYYSSCFFFISFLGSVGYYFILKKVPAKLTILFFNFYMFPAVVAYWIVFVFESEGSLRFIVHYNIFIIFCGVTFIFTENILLAMCQMSFYVTSCAFILNQYNQKSILQITWIPIMIIWFLQFHTKIKRKRQMFQQSQVNESIYELIKQTTKDDFYLFSYDSERQNYTLQLTNKEQLQINEFLKNFYQGNTNLSTYLYRQFILDNNNTPSIQVINGFYSNGKTPQKYYLYVQTYPKLSFYMRMIPPAYKPKLMFIHHHQIINNFFHSIDKLHIKGSISVEQLIQLINKVKINFQLQTISATLHLYASDRKYICLKKLFEFICKSQGLEAKIDGQSHVHSNPRVIQIYLSALIFIIKQFNSNITIHLHRSRLSTSIAFRFDIALDCERILQTQYFNCLKIINRVVGLSPISMQPNMILISLITNRELPFIN